VLKILREMKLNAEIAEQVKIDAMPKKLRKEYIKNKE
jgi:hypothetical protein